MEKTKNFMWFAGAQLGTLEHRKAQNALAICRQLRNLLWSDQTLAPLRRQGVTPTGDLNTLEGRGAVERVLWLSNRALRANPSVGLLRRVGILRQSDSSARTRAWTGTEPTGAGGAGAPFARRLARLLHTLYRASLIVGGRVLPSSPCMNELPSHAPYSTACFLRPYGVYARPFGAGLKKLF